MTAGRNPLVVSLGLFSTLPVPATAHIDRRVAAGAMASFPLVGLVLGALAGAFAWAVGWLGGALLGSVLGVATLAWLTGALHLDGVADTADGLGSRRPPEQALEIMRRSDIGPMGVISLLLVLLVDVVALSVAMDVAPLAGALAIVLAAVLGRVVVVLATTPADAGARPEGFGALFHGVTSATTATLWAVAGLAAAGAGGWFVAGLPGACVFGGAGVLSLVVGWAWRGHLVRRLGGMTGDTFGSIVEIVQCVFLLVVAVGLGVVARLLVQ